MPLPNYVTIFDNNPMLTRPAKAVRFPLSEDILDIIKILETKYDAEEGCAGLAAPQIGFDHRIIIFALEYSEELKARRTDLEETMKKTIWINPSYEPVGEQTTEDWEACFSVGQGIRAKVKRYTKIKYSAFDISGQKIIGTASGFLARIIQHETDHIDGVLFIQKVKPEDIVMTQPTGA